MLAGGELVLDLGPTGTIEIIEHRGEFEKGALADQFVETLRSDEMIVAPVDFSLARLARGVRHRYHEVRP